MTKLTPYVSSLVLLGAVLILCTSALLYFLTLEDESNIGVINAYQKEIQKINKSIQLYRQEEAEQTRLHWAYKDSVKAMKSRLADKEIEFDNLKRQANAVRNMDYRRFTDDELAVILTRRYSSE